MEKTSGRSLGIIPKASDSLYGFMSDELNDSFSSIAIPPTLKKTGPLIQIFCDV